MSRFSVLFLPFMCACAAIGHTHSSTALPGDCPGPATLSTQFESDRWSSLAGTFRLTTVQTSHGGSPLVWRELLTLQRTDSVTRYALRTPMSPLLGKSDRPLIGTAHGDAPNDRPSPAEYEAGRLYVGCRWFQCTDASPLVYVIEWQTSDRFGGTWRDYQSGIVRVFDHGNPLPDPAGHFCAMRLPGPTP